MMAFIGFLVMLLGGVYGVFAAVAGAYVTTAFGGRIQWAHFIIFGGIGAALLYGAITNAPFTIAFGAAA